MKNLIMKFGGASISTPQHFSQIASLILKRKRENQRVVVVISAMGDSTDQLIALAKEVHPNPPRREYDMLVTVGERISISLLAMALARKNQEAISFTGSQSGIITSTDHSEARIVDVRPFRIIHELEQEKVVIVAGFQGVSVNHEITTLGRGGSDTTAVALGVALKATKVEFYKDVPGIFEEDPKVNPNTKMYSQMTYDDALRVVQKGGQVLQSRCLQLAKKNFLPLHVRSFCSKTFDQVKGTVVCDTSKQSLEQPQYEECNDR